MIIRIISFASDRFYGIGLFVCCSLLWLNNYEIFTLKTPDHWLVLSFVYLFVILWKIDSMKKEILTELTLEIKKVGYEVKYKKV